MGFIDYHGNKEDRYQDVLEYARAQQEEELRRREDEKVNKWLIGKIKDNRYISISINDLMKYIIVRYRSMKSVYEKMIDQSSGVQTNREKRLWIDFCIALVSRRLDRFDLEIDIKNKYYHIFLEKVFKLEEFTSAEQHYKSIMNNVLYKRYMEECYDLNQKRYFWRWIAYIGKKEDSDFIGFVNTYKQLSILLGYYLFQGIRSQNTLWMTQLDTEIKYLERLEKDYFSGKLAVVHNDKLINPIYQEKKNVLDDWQNNHLSKENDLSEDNKKRSELDRKKFDWLLEQKDLSSYISVCQLLKQCNLPDEIDNIYKELILRIPVLQESLSKFKEIYEPEMDDFYDYYIPEALKITATYIEYVNVGIGLEILEETEKEVIDVTKKLLLAVNSKIDEIYKFASIKVKAKAKALESIMSQDGYVDPEYTINKKSYNIP